MVGCFLRMRIVLARVGKNVSRARQRPDLNFLHLLRMQVVALDQVKHRRNWSVRQRLSRKKLHPALRDTPRLAESIRQQVLLPLRTKTLHQPFFAVDDVFGAAVALLGEQRGQNTALRCQWIDRILHHRQLPCRHRAHGAMPRSRNSNGMLNLFPTQMQRASRHDRRDERRQRRMMPAALANARKRRLAQAHFEFVAQHKSNNQFLAIALGALTTRHRRRKDIGRMRRILLPVNVVVIHAADHQRIRQRRGNRIDLLARADHGRRPAPGNLLQHFERNHHVMLPISTQRAARRIEQKALGLVHRVLRELRVLKSRRPAGHGRGNGLFADSLWCRQGQLLAVRYWLFAIK